MKNLLIAAITLACLSAHAGNCGNGKGNGNACTSSPTPTTTSSGAAQPGSSSASRSTARSTSTSKAAASVAVNAGTSSFSSGGTASNGPITANGGAGGSSTGSDVTIQQQRLAATAVAPSMSPTANCAMTAAIGVQGPGAGLSLGGSKIEENCAKIERAKVLYASGKWNAGDELLCDLQDIREARARVGDPCRARPEVRSGPAYPYTRD